jgi:DNA polymerase-3 subunit epsilon
MDNFVAIDFETATGKRDSACQVGIVMVKDGVIAHEWSTLIKPPGNKYGWAQTGVHGLKSKDTENAPTFKEVYPDIKRRIKGHTIVAHNAKFDKSVLQKTMESNGLDYKELDLEGKWRCTIEKEKKDGHTKIKLNECCERYDIKLDHHEALSDARACAKVYMVDSKQSKLNL